MNIFAIYEHIFIEGDFENEKGKERQGRHLRGLVY
jgi:hypothetical protein